MKTILLSLIFTTATYAQEVGVKVNATTSGNEDTTISIKKGPQTVTNKKVYTISEGSEDVTGDNDVLKKNAEKNWKTACSEFKTEFKEMNKENKIISLSCGTMVCNKEGVESSCKSKATYKVRVLAEE